MFCIQGTSEDAATENEYTGGIFLERKIDLTSYIRWWGPKKTRRSDPITKSSEETHGNSDAGSELKTFEWPSQHTEPYQLPSLGLSHKGKPFASAVSACSILAQSAAFKKMQEKASESHDVDQKNNIGHEKTILKLSNVGGSERSGVALSLGEMPLQKPPYNPLAPFLSAPLLTNCNNIDPLPDSAFWTNLIQPTGLSLGPTVSI